MKRQHLRRRDIRGLEESLRERYGIDLSLPKKGRVERVALKDTELLIVEGKPWFFSVDDGRFVPTLHFLLENQILKSIVIDMPAVRFIINGADVMRPGIVHIDEGITEGDAVCIMDEQHHKPLAVGLALFSSEDMQKLDSGKAVKNIHHVGDDIWNAAA